MKIDFAQMLLRRRFTVERWLESEGIATVKSFKNWMKNMESSYTFSDAFIADAKEVLMTNPEPKPIEAPEPVKNALVELPQGEVSSESETTGEERPRKNNKPGKVQTGPREE